MRALFNLSDYAMIAAEVAAGTTAPALLKERRAQIYDPSAMSLACAGRYSETLPLYEENAAYYESISDMQNFGICLSGLGRVYINQGLIEKALEMAQRAQSLSLSSDTSLEQLSQLLFELGLHDKGLMYDMKALDCEERESGKNTLRRVTSVRGPSDANRH